MAKEAAPEGEDGEKPEGEAAPEPKKGLKRFLSKKILMIAVPVLLLVLGGGGAGAYFFLMKAPDEHAQAAHEEEVPLTPPKVAFSDMQDILVNIQSSDGTPAYLKLSLSLEMDNDLEKAGITALTPRLV